MADFPYLEPSTRSYDLGAYPITAQPTWGAADIRFKHGNSPVLPPLDLAFELITDFEADLIETHWLDHGIQTRFHLPQITFLGNSNSGGPAPLSFLWLYIAAPVFTSRVGGLKDVTVQLECVG